MLVDTISTEESDILSESYDNLKIYSEKKKSELKDVIKTADERSLYIKIDRFFKNKCSVENINKMVNIINKTNCKSEKGYNISLRLLNWFAMKYSSEMESIEIINEDKSKGIFDVRISYRAVLDTYSKKYFDPFRRGKTFDYNYDKSDKLKTVVTTLCQINFFMWLFSHDLLSYVETNYEVLSREMADHEKTRKISKLNKKNQSSKIILKDNNIDEKPNIINDKVKLILTF